MDWSFLRPHVNPPLLRPELLYRNIAPVSKRKLVLSSCGTQWVPALGILFRYRKPILGPLKPEWKLSTDMACRFRTF